VLTDSREPAPAASPLRRAWSESRLLTLLALGALVVGAVLAARTGARLVLDPTMTPYKAPQFWLGYEGGFVRRGLPGEVLGRLTGSPTLQQANAVAAGLSLLGAAAVVPLALAAARGAPSGLRRLLAAVLLLASPLTLSLLLHDVGRFDAIGVVALAALACAARVWNRLPLAAGATAVAALLAVACATQELFLGLLAPAALGRTALLSGFAALGRARRRLLLAGVLTPGAVLTGASAVSSPSDEAVRSARAEAQAAGVPPPDELGDALDAVAADVVENLAFFGLFPAGAIAATLLLWVAVYAASVLLLGRILGSGTGAFYGWASAYHTALAVALSALGVDFRRWWGLALLGLTATVVLARMLREGDEPAPFVRWLPLPVALVATVGLAAGGLALWDAPVFPDP
jgi:hypothetical protein